ncbi:putative ATP-dependent permease [Auxenochlorella protothecoides]|nr:putative ATP-dependent permease [Auxenochlorella protothecoides]KFM28717.1 putative ATP-dependent permease [Auxenochlorella protothecoides]
MLGRLVLLFWIPFVHGTCNISLSLAPSASTFQFGGSVVQPLAAPLALVPPTLVTGLQGNVLLLLSDVDACPTTGEGVLAALPGATLSTTNATGRLAMYPTTVLLESGTLVNLTWQDVEFDLSTTAFVPGATADIFAVDASLLVSGGGSTQTSLLATNQPVPLLGINGTGSGTVAVTGDGQALNLTLSGLDLTMVGEYEGTLGGSPLRGVTNYTVTDLRLVAGTALGCTPACGEHGRCMVPQNGATAQPACECECGWSGVACTMAAGYCSAFPLDAGASCPESANASPPPPSPPPGPAPCVATQTCSTLQVYNSSTAGCDCAEDWGGLGCTACQNDGACSALVPGLSSGTCSSSRNFTEQTAFLSYQCDLEVNFALTSSADNPLSCRASNCAFQLGTSIAQCSSVSCSCKEACPVDLQGVLDVIEGNPCTLSCNEVTGECTFDIQDFFVTLIAPCTNAQCIVEGYTASQGNYVAPASSKNYDPVIAAIPLMALIGLVGFLLAYLLFHPVVWRSGGEGRPTAPAPAPASGALGIAAPGSLGGGPLSLRWEAVGCVVPAPASGVLGAMGAACAPWGARRGAGDGLAILHGVSGHAERGELVGLLGPSGSGKTTLLGILAQSGEALDRRAALTGRVVMEGSPARCGPGPAFVPQEDTLLATLSVEECVRYAALLKGTGAGVGASQGDIAARVTAVLQELGLEGVARSRVGGAALSRRGISGGERRRVSIAMELVHGPGVLILDEPTSGLDSFTALNLMHSLKRVARAGRIVVLSFHQPSPAMFSLLDRAYLLARGRAVYGGDPASAAAFFKSRGVPCPAGDAIAEHMLHAASDPVTLGALLAGVQGNGAAGGGSPRVLPAGHGTVGAGKDGAAEKGPADAQELALVELEAGPGTTRSGTEGSQGVDAAGRGTVSDPGPGRSRSLELAVLFWRAGLDIARNPSLLLLHWAMALGMGIFTGCIFLNVGLDISGAQNRAGGLFFILAFFAFTSLTAVDLFMAERRLVMREIKGGMYHPVSYLVTKAALDGLLLRVIPAFLYAAPFYPMMGLQSDSTIVAVFLFVLATFSLVVGAFALAVTVGCTTAGKASLVMNVVLLISLLVGGFFVNVASIAAWIRWLHYASVFFYAYTALITNEVATLSLDFVVEGYAAVKNVRGVAFLNIIGVDAGDLTRNIIILDCLYAGLLLVAMLVLWLRLPTTASMARVSRR